jgi:hypothetical protein
MAIHRGHYRLMVEHRDILPRGGDVLQIGDANWYGDVDPRVILELTSDQKTRDLFRPFVESESLFDIADAFYGMLFAPKTVHSVDMRGRGMRLDLNKPLQLDRQYDLSINHGTAEHVFHIAQVFGTMHAWTKTGGLMIHESPFFGWPDHGFYTLQPTLFYDLADANGYEIVSVSLTELATGDVQRVESRAAMHAIVNERRIPENAILFVVMRKGAEADFRIPMQGVYDGKLDSEGKRAWQEAR